MKTAILLVMGLLTVFADETAAAPAPAPSDHPVQLVVLGTKALKALGIHLPQGIHRRHQHQHQHHQLEGQCSDHIAKNYVIFAIFRTQVNSGRPAEPNDSCNI